MVTGKNTLSEDIIKQILNDEKLRNEILEKIKNYSIGKYAIPNVSSPLNSERDFLNINITNKNSINAIKNNKFSYHIKCKIT